MLSDYGYLFMPDDSLNSIISYEEPVITHTHTHTSLMALCTGLPGWASTRKVKPIWILLKQETLIGSGISWAICKSATRSRQITTPAPLHSVFTGRTPFLPPKQQRQSTEGKNQVQLSVIEKNYFLSLFAPIRELSHSQNSQCIRSLYSWSWSRV